MVCDMYKLESPMSVEMLSRKEAELLSVVRKKLKSCDDCMEHLVEFVRNLEIKKCEDGKNDC